MPVFNFATYADVREEWAIRADNLDHARALVGVDANGDWLDHALHLDAEPIARRDEFVMDDDVPAIDEITPQHWGWREAHRDEIERSLRQNIAAISGDFHAHPLCSAFYETFGKLIDGFTGQYEFCIAMAEALTEWEIENGLAHAYESAGVTWIEVIEDFVETTLETAIRTGALPEPAHILPTIQVLARRPS